MVIEVIVTSLTKEMTSMLNKVWRHHENIDYFIDTIRV
jgi:hypothetical protein